MHRDARRPQPATAQRLATGAFFLLLLFLFAHPSPAAANQAIDQRYGQAKAYYQKLLHSELGKDRQNWLTGAQTFRKLYQANPEHGVAPKALFMLGNIYKSMHDRSRNPLDLGEAIAYYEDVATLFPKSNLADDALFLAGNIYLTAQNDPQKAARTFARIVALYPRGDMTSGAAEQLHKLKGIDYLNSLNTEINARAATAAANSPEGEQCQKAEVLPVRYWSNKNYTRVVIETTAPVTFRRQMLEKSGDRPRRLYVDLLNCQISPSARNTVPIGDGLLTQVRNAQFTPDTVRVVLDTQSNISDYKIFSLDDPFRVVIDVKGSEPAALEQKTPNGSPTLAQQLGLGIRRVVIDPGHGGKDPGAISPSGIKEKDITLAVAKKLATELREQTGCEVILTRDRDVFIPLEERTAIANSKEADLFLSIHVNAAPNKAAKGIETYVLDLATNKEAMRVAALENATSTRNLSDLQVILLDLIQNSKMNESVKLAELVQGTMVQGVKRDYGHVNNLGVKKAPFIVLVGAQMPAILTEIAFSTNPEEEERLRDERYLALVAQHIAGGVSQYATSLNLASNSPYGD